MSATIYAGNFNYYPFASNENFYLVHLNGWVERGQAIILSTFSINSDGVTKATWDQTSSYVLLRQDQFLDTFIIQDLDKKLYYWFNGSRNSTDDTLTLNLVTGSSPTLATIVLSPVP